VQLALVNGPTACTVCGLPRAVRALRSALARDFVVGSAAAAAQAALPFYKRRPRLAAVRPVGVSAPFHCSVLMGDAHGRILRDAERLGLRIPASELRCAVYSTAGGCPDLRQAELDDDDDVVAALVRMQVTQPVMWPAATRAVSAREGVTHLLDFGPGGAAGTAGLSARMLAERGDGAVTVVLASATTMEDIAPEGSRCDAMRCDVGPLPRARRRRRRRRRLLSCLTCSPSSSRASLLLLTLRDARAGLALPA